MILFIVTIDDEPEYKSVLFFTGTSSQSLADNKLVQFFIAIVGCYRML